MTTEVSVSLKDKFIVFYDGDYVVGGGVIESSLNKLSV